MLGRQNRLDLKKDFVFLKEKGVMVSSPFFGLLFSISALKDKPRFAFLISTKVSKKAVVRNQLKRRLSAFVEEKLPLAKSGTKAVFLVKGRAVDASRADLRQAVDQALLKAKITTK